MAKNTQSLAKEIREEGESWDSALERAKAIKEAEENGDSSEKKSDNKSGAKPNKSKKAEIKGANKQKASGTKAKKTDLKPGKANSQKGAGSTKVEKAEKPEFVIVTIKQAKSEKGEYSKKGSTVVRKKQMITVEAADAMNEAFKAGMNGRYCEINEEANAEYQKSKSANK